MILNLNKFTSFYVTQNLHPVELLFLVCFTIKFACIYIMFLLNEYKIINYVTVFSFISFFVYVQITQLSSDSPSVNVNLKFFVFQIVDINRVIFKGVVIK